MKILNRKGDKAMLDAIESSKILSVKAGTGKAENGALAINKKARDTKNTDSNLVQNARKLEEDTKEQGSEQLKQLAKELNAQMDLLNTNIAFDFSDETERLYLRVLEKDTGKLIREFPSEDARALAGYFRNAVGLLFDEES